MHTKKMKDLHEKATAAAEKARAIAETAEAAGRPLTELEKASYNVAMKVAKETLGQLKVANEDAEILDEARSMFQEIGGPLSSSEGGKRGNWGQKSTEVLRNVMGGRTDGSKALVSGTVRLNNPVLDGVQAMPGAPTTILDLLVRGKSLEPHLSGDGSGRFQGGSGQSNTYTYLRQTVRDNKAAPVADGALKPTSVYTMKEIEDRYRVIAHLSEPVPARFFSDDAQLASFLSSEMGYGLRLALEEQALNGDGLGENFTGILQTSGLQVQTWAADLITTTRKALTKLQSQGITPTAWALNPDDAEALDLLRENATDGRYLMGSPGGDTSQMLWTLPRVVTNAVSAGTGVLGNWDAAEVLVHDDGVDLHVDAGGALFDKNQLKMRVEGRFGLAVQQPSAFVKVALAAE